MRGNNSKGVYEDFVTSVERGFYTSELDKVVDRNLHLIQQVRWDFARNWGFTIAATTSHIVR